MSSESLQKNQYSGDQKTEKTELKMMRTKIFVRKNFHSTKIRFSAEVHTATLPEHSAQCVRGDSEKTTVPSAFALTALRIHPMKSAGTKKSPVLFASVAFILVYAELPKMPASSTRT